MWKWLACSYTQRRGGKAEVFGCLVTSAYIKNEWPAKVSIVNNIYSILKLLMQEITVLLDVTETM